MGVNADSYGTDSHIVHMPARPGGEYFAAPADPTHRRYEALRAYLYEGTAAADVAARFGYTEATLASLVKEFRAGRREFFIIGKPGPKTAPAKERARFRIVALRQQGHSAYEIAALLTQEGMPRPHAERGLPVRDRQPRTGPSTSPAGRAGSRPAAPGCCWLFRTGSARPARTGASRWVPGHQRGPGRVLGPVAAGAQAHRHPQGQPRR